MTRDKRAPNTTPSQSQTSAAGTNPVKAPTVTPTQDETNQKDLLGIKKPPVSLIPAAALLHEAMAMKNGAEKYGAFNFRQKKVQAMIYADAAFRHLLAWIDGEEAAADSGVHHLGHARACLAILLDAQACGNLVDNRPSTGRAAAIIEALTVK